MSKYYKTSCKLIIFKYYNNNIIKIFLHYILYQRLYVYGCGLLTRKLFNWLDEKFRDRS